MGEQLSKEDSRYRVAYDLMLTIAHNESEKVGTPDPRTYYLTLYYQCLKATMVEQMSLKGILSEE